MSFSRQAELYRIPVGLDAPKTIFVWTVPEITVALSAFFILLILNEVMLGIGVCMGVLYLLYDLNQTQASRGQFTHLIWHLGLSSKQDPLSFAPNPLMVRLDG